MSRYCVRLVLRDVLRDGAKSAPPQDERSASQDDMGHRSS